VSKGSKSFLIEVVVRPVVIVIGFVVTGLYGILVGWWYGKFVRFRKREELGREIQNQMWFVFEERNGRVVENGDIGHLAALDCAIVTVAAEGLLLRFVQWRDNSQVHVSSERCGGWHELAAVLNVMLPGEVARHSIVSFNHAGRLLRDHWNLLKKAFSEECYSDLTQQLEQEHGYEMVATRQLQNEINRRIND
jgi:hypothetical protein